MVSPHRQKVLDRRKGIDNSKKKKDSDSILEKKKAEKKEIEEKIKKLKEELK